MNTQCGLHFFQSDATDFSQATYRAAGTGLCTILYCLEKFLLKQITIVIPPIGFCSFCFEFGNLEHGACGFGLEFQDDGHDERATVGVLLDEAL